jgi:hypothetical protein
MLTRYLFVFVHSNFSNPSHLFFTPVVYMQNKLMKGTGIICIVLIGMLNSSTAKAQDYKGAIGVRFSSKAALVSNSVSLKYFFNEKTLLPILLHWVYWLNNINLLLRA